MAFSEKINLATIYIHMKKKSLFEKADTILVGHDYEPCVKERRAILLLSIACSEKHLKIDDFMKMTKVSRNTLLEDMKQLKEALSKQQLTLHYQAASGYLISGEERAIRLALKPYIHFIRNMIKNEKTFPSVWLKGPISYKRIHASPSSSQNKILSSSLQMTCWISCLWISFSTLSG